MALIEVADSMLVGTKTKYHAYSAATSDGKECVRGYSFKQMLKFALPWLLTTKFKESGEPILVRRLGPDNEPITVLIRHEHQEFLRPEEAARRGLLVVLSDDPEPPFEKIFEAVSVPMPEKRDLKTCGHWQLQSDLNGRAWELRERSPSSIMEAAKAIESEALVLEAKAKAARERAARIAATAQESAAPKVVAKVTAK